MLTEVDDPYVMTRAYGQIIFRLCMKCGPARAAFRIRLQLSARDCRGTLS
jgi:hypothetical protein